MSLLKRTFTSLYAKVDQMVGEIENHDALIQAAIREQKKKIATAKVQLRRIEAAEKDIRERIAQANIDRRQWESRAVKEAGDNEPQALQCLQRRKEVQARSEQLNTMLQEYQTSSGQMKANIHRCEQDLNEMNQKHQILRARQSTAEAMSLIDGQESYPATDISDSFDRWEIKISQSEHFVDIADNTDALEQAYIDEENEQDLRSELAELLKQDRMNKEG